MSPRITSLGVTLSRSERSLTTIEVVSRLGSWLLFNHRKLALRRAWAMSTTRGGYYCHRVVLADCHRPITAPGSGQAIGWSLLAVASLLWPLPLAAGVRSLLRRGRASVILPLPWCRRSTGAIIHRSANRDWRFHECAWLSCWSIALRIRLLRCIGP